MARTVTSHPRAVDASQVADNVAAVRERIARAGGADRVRLVAVTKGFGVDAVHAALAAGVPDIGENYLQELEAKAAAVEGSSSVRWHVIGRVQRNKVRRVAGVVHLWQSVDRAEVGLEIAARSPGAAVLVQVNTSGEGQKAGCRLRDAPALAGALRAQGLDVRGLMTIGPADDPAGTRVAFRRLSVLGTELDVRELSMGMSDDLDIAVEEGATMVRIGRGLFGERSSHG
jgi:pyridoxal phosphate enzyme (YggS family)